MQANKRFFLKKPDPNQSVANRQASNYTSVFDTPISAIPGAHMQN